MDIRKPKPIHGWREFLAEIGRDDGPQAYERVAIARYLAQRLDRLEAALIAERDAGVPFRPAEAYDPAYHTWDEDGWRAAGASDVAASMSIARLAQ